MANNVDFSEVDDIAVVTMSNGEQVNTIDIPLCHGLLRSLCEIADRKKHRAVILRASGKAFSAGGDLAQIFSAIENSDDGYLEELITTFHSSVLAIRRLAVPVVASVHGAAAGAGFSLAMACDLSIASDNARFVVGYPKLGTSTDGGLSYQLTRRLGAARAIDLLLHKDSLTAEEALSMGLVQRVCAPDSLDDAAMASAKKIAALPPAGVREIKSLVSRLADADFEAHLIREKEAFVRCSETVEFRETISHFASQTTNPKG
jgi:2-(1,2-epoxy-1,2-dihydrophenyl)acetyl-CoA isomerase